MKPPHPILTVGHSTHPISVLVDRLHNLGVTAVADVRSVPFSRWTPQFNQEALRRTLREASLSYVFLGKALGARSDDPACYLDGKVQYRRIAKTSVFREGIDRLIEGSKAERIAIMCAEGEPLDCHRTILVSRELVAAGAEVAHLLPNGVVEPHEESLRRLMERLRMLQPAFFESPDELLGRVYAEQESRIAYVRSDRVREDEVQR